WTSRAVIEGAQAASAAGRQAVTGELVRLLDARPDLRRALAAGITRAGLAGLSTPEDFFAYVDELATWIPVERELKPRGLRFYYLIDQAPDDALNQDPEFNAWLG